MGRSKARNEADCRVSTKRRNGGGGEGFGHLSYTIHAAAGKAEEKRERRMNREGAE